MEGNRMNLTIGLGGKERRQGMVKGIGLQDHQ